eukprot:583197-Prymnesium_polylepis.1
MDYCAHIGDVTGKVSMAHLYHTGARAAAADKVAPPPPRARKRGTRSTPDADPAWHEGVAACGGCAAHARRTAPLDGCAPHVNSFGYPWRLNGVVRARWRRRGVAGAHGVPRDEDAALHWFRSAARQGDGMGHANLGLMQLRRGQYRAAVDSLRRATKLHDVSAWAGVGYRWRGGLSTPRRPGG